MNPDFNNENLISGGGDGGWGGGGAPNKGIGKILEINKQGGTLLKSSGHLKLTQNFPKN